MPVKSMSKGTRDGLFYLPKYDFSTPFEEFMDTIGNMKFEYPADYKPCDVPWYPQYPSTFKQQIKNNLELMKASSMDASS